MASSSAGKTPAQLLLESAQAQAQVLEAARVAAAAIYQQPAAQPAPVPAPGSARP